METKGLRISESYSLDLIDFSALIDVLRDNDYEIIGPRLRQRAIVLDRISSVDDLPSGWTDSQEAAKYRVLKRDDQQLFAYNVGASSWKRFLFPPRHSTMRTKRVEGRLTVEADEPPKTKLALIGIKPCEVAAIGVQDRTFLNGPYIDDYYRSIREKLLIIATNCIQAGGTCFCTSMGTGPEAKDGFDLSLTEVASGKSHIFIIKAGTGRGLEILSALPVLPASSELQNRATKLIAAAGKKMQLSIDTTDIVERIYARMESPHWDDVASRCLSCGNCTMVCPTCFCYNVEEHSSLDGASTEQLRLWDSCFSLEHSYLHGGYVRRSLRSRYRQWLTHKLAGWHEQFGVSGCVGCGRCITWCPVGIDITAEYGALIADVQSEKKKRARVEAR